MNKLNDKWNHIQNKTFGVLSSYLNDDVNELGYLFDGCKIVPPLLNNDDNTNITN